MKKGKKTNFIVEKPEKTLSHGDDQGQYQQ